MGLAIVPASQPRLTHEDALNLMGAGGIVAPAVGLLGIRGYYLDAMGVAGRNDRNIYDDCIAVVGLNVFATFNANTDPSVTRKGVAVLDTGVWKYKLGLHGITRGNPYPALVQAAPVRVIRDETGADTGWFGLNIHRGGRTTTSSLGCQTIWPDQWAAFLALVKAEMQRRAQKTINYVLVDEMGRRSKAA